MRLLYDTIYVKYQWQKIYCNSTLPDSLLCNKLVRYIQYSILCSPTTMSRHWTESKSETIFKKTPCRGELKIENILCQEISSGHLKNYFCQENKPVLCWVTLPSLQMFHETYFNLIGQSTFLCQSSHFHLMMV